MTPLGGASAPPDPLLNGACGADGDFFVFLEQERERERVRDGNFLVFLGSVSPAITSYCLHDILLPNPPNKLT